MEISGRIIAALPARSGTSARTGNTWMSQEFVIETHEQYPRKCVFTVFGEDRLKEMNIEVGKEMTVSFDIDAHEYNGRYPCLASCTSHTCHRWRIKRSARNAAKSASNEHTYCNCRASTSKRRG